MFTHVIIQVTQHNPLCTPNYTHAQKYPVKQMREYLLEVIAYFIFKNSFLHFFSVLFQRSVLFLLLFSIFCLFLFLPAIIQTISSIIVFHSFILFLLRSFIMARLITYFVLIIKKSTKPTY